MAERIAAARPAMAGLGAAVRRLAAELADAGPREAREVSERRAAALAAGAEAAARAATALLPAHPTVVTCSYGSAVPRLIAAALRAGVRAGAVVFEPDPDPGSHGRRMVRRITALGAPCALEPAPPDPWPAGAVGAIGADAVTPRWVVNGSPSLRLATAAAAAGAPVYVVCEDAKLTGVAPAPEPGMDLVEIGLVTAVVTESGPMGPGGVSARISCRSSRP